MRIGLQNKAQQAAAQPTEPTVTTEQPQGSLYIPSALLLTNDGSCRFRDPQFDPFIRIVPGSTWGAYLQANSSRFPLSAHNVRIDATNTTPTDAGWDLENPAVTDTTSMLSTADDREYYLPAMRIEFTRDRDAAPGARITVGLSFTTPTLEPQAREVTIHAGTAEAFTLYLPFSNEAASASYTTFALVHNTRSVTAGAATFGEQTYYREPPSAANSASGVLYPYGLRSSARVVNTTLTMAAGYHADVQPVIPTASDYEFLASLQMSSPPTWASNVRKMK